MITRNVTISYAICKKPASCKYLQMYNLQIADAKHPSFYWQTAVPDEKSRTYVGYILNVRQYSTVSYFWFCVWWIECQRICILKVKYAKATSKKGCYFCEQNFGTNCEICCIEIYRERKTITEDVGISYLVTFLMKYEQKMPQIFLHPWSERVVYVVRM